MRRRWRDGLEGTSLLALLTSAATTTWMARVAGRDHHLRLGCRIDDATAPFARALAQDADSTSDKDTILDLILDCPVDTWAGNLKRNISFVDQNLQPRAHRLVNLGAIVYRYARAPVHDQVNVSPPGDHTVIDLNNVESKGLYYRHQGVANSVF